MYRTNNILLGVLIIYATIFNPFNDGGKNMLLVFSLPIFLAGAAIRNRDGLKGLFEKKNSIIWIFLIYFLLSSIVNFQSLRLSSLAYSLDFIICFILCIHLFKRPVNLRLYSKYLTIIIGIFFLALVIQQIGIVLGFDHFFNKLDSTDYYIESNYIFNLNSLSTEPSYAVTIVSVAFYSILKMRRIENDGNYVLLDFLKDTPVWAMYLYQLVFYRSVFGILFFVMICIYLVDFKKIKTWILLGCFSFVLGVLSANYEALGRLFTIFKMLDLHNITELAQIDHSGSMRVLPLYYYLVNFNFRDFHSYIGYGLDYSQDYIRALIPGIPDGTAFGGLIPSFPFDFGIIGFGLLWKVISKFALMKWLSIEAIIIFLVMLNATFNTQMFWFVVLVFTINKFIVSSRTPKTPPLATASE
ncbi:hypothetical protein [Geothrix sp. SG200]|uniref:hypothetical protein n=1 Tax=Geothrix sp. SG200 TaxID=2922865 RepID=UPI001FAB81D1|nr:hypothetical protein [Geothrix sp. SG200]